MTWFEILCLIVLAFGFIRGWMNGLVKELCASAGIILGLLVAYYCYSHFGLGIGWAIVLCILFPLGLGIIASIVSKAMDKVLVVGTLNKVLGAIVGCLKYALVIYAIWLVVEKVEEWKNLLF